MSARRFRKKPVEIEARRLGYEHEINSLTVAWLNEHDCDFYLDFDGIRIRTLEGEMLAGWGDWIIRGIAGEFYPCKPDIFEQTYESAEDAA